MKKLLLGSILGGLIIFIWQFLSFSLLELHRPATQYTPKQEEILSFLNSQFTESGSYALPNYPDNASMEEQQALNKSAEGKPWAVISYHKSLDADMTMNMVRGFLIDIIMVGLLCWIIAKFHDRSYANIVMTALAVGLIVFFNVPYTNHIWFPSFDLNAYLIDAIVPWTLVGLVLGAIYNNRRATR